jgi:hypothetical protein
MDGAPTEQGTAMLVAQLVARLRESRLVPAEQWAQVEVILGEIGEPGRWPRSPVRSRRSLASVWLRATRPSTRCESRCRGIRRRVPTTRA